MSKPDWESAPKWANYHAIDADGSAWWHSNRPTWNEVDGIWLSDKICRDDKAVEAELSLKARP